VNEPDFQLSDVIAGTYDPYIRSFAAAAKSWGHPFFLRFDHEMNGNWFEWSERVNGNGPGQYVAAWRHVHDVFTSVGATNATWVWCPNVNISHELQSFHSLYPGGDYVDWTCMDGFNWGHSVLSPGWMSFGKIFRSTYRKIAKLAPSKPMIIGETASSDRGGSKAAWIRDMFRSLAKGFRKIHGLIWFDVNDRNTHWPIETSRSATRAFRNGIRRRLYAANAYADLSASPIPAPR
jgi:beta-mannanase